MIIREPIRANPLPDECNQLARMQSLLSRGGRAATIDDAKRALRKLPPGAPVAGPQPVYSRGLPAVKPIPMASGLTPRGAQPEPERGGSVRADSDDLRDCTGWLESEADFAREEAITDYADIRGE